MPVLEDEAATYGYTLEDRHTVECFRKGDGPIETFRDGVAVVVMLIGAPPGPAGRSVCPTRASKPTFRR